TARMNITAQLDNQPVAMTPAARQQAIDEAMLLFTLPFIAAIVLGVVFIALGVVVKAFPVPVTILAFVLFLGSNLALTALAPISLCEGGIIKLIVAIALFQAILAAVAYEKEKRFLANPEVVPARKRAGMRPDWKAAVQSSRLVGQTIEARP